MIIFYIKLIVVKLYLKKMTASILKAQPYKLTFSVLFMLLGCALLVTGFVLESMMYIFASTLPIMLSSGIILLIYLSSNDSDTYTNGYGVYL